MSKFLKSLFTSKEDIYLSGLSDGYENAIRLTDCMMQIYGHNDPALKTMRDQLERARSEIEVITHTPEEHRHEEISP